MERGFDVCSPRGGRHSRKSNRSMATIFLSTPSARRATLCRWAADHRWRISIHALREEGDATARDTTCRRMNFYPRPPRGGRQSSPYIWMMVLTFLSTPSVRRATITLSEFLLRQRISIHALREEGDLELERGLLRFKLFLSTPSARRATLSSGSCC